VHDLFGKNTFEELYSSITASTVRTHGCEVVMHTTMHLPPPDICTDVCFGVVCTQAGGRQLFLEGKWEEAARAFTDAIQGAPGVHVLLTNRALCNQKLERCIYFPHSNSFLSWSAATRVECSLVLEYLGI
jgi:hypothetical protein